LDDRKKSLHVVFIGPRNQGKNPLQNDGLPKQVWDMISTSDYELVEVAVKRLESAKS